MKKAREIIVDIFAGGGGASSGIAEAIGRGPDVAVNHNAAAIVMHAANHPTTKHFTEDVYKLKPSIITGGRPVGLLWMSPDCKHFSRAKGGKPVEKKIRGLAWSVTNWIKDKRTAPRVIVLENVREFEDWGPLIPRWDCSACDWKGTEGQATLARTRRRCPRCESPKLLMTEHLIPDPGRKGWTFRQFVGRLKARGYVVAWKVLNAADFGAPTHRRRLFLIARNDGKPIVWPDATHGDPKKLGTGLFDADLSPWRTAAECIDWSLPCPSIFERKRPLKEKTLRRIAMGIKRYVIDNPKPFIVDMHRDNRSRGADEPAGTVTTQGNKFNLITPVVAPLTHDGERRSYSPAEPLPTVTGANRGELGVIAPHITKFHQGCVGSGIDEPVPTVTANSYIKRPGGAAPLGVVTATLSKQDVGAPILYPRYGEFPGQTPRCGTVDALPTVTASGNCGQIAVPILSQYHGQKGDEPRCQPMTDPVNTLDTQPRYALLSPTLIGAGGPEYSAKPREADRPLGTLTADPRAALVSAFLAKHYGGPRAVPGQVVDKPLGTVTSVDHHSAVAANLVRFNHDDAGVPVDAPTPTVMAGGMHAALVYSFLVKYFGKSIGVEVESPLPTATGKDRFGLVLVHVDGEPYVIVDIGMRMLKPRELARAQGFPDSYILTGTATNQVERIGNSVCPPVAHAIVAANFTPQTVRRKTAVPA